MDIEILNEANDEKMKGYMTIAIEPEENDIKIGIIRAENDIEEEEIDVHIAASSTQEDSP